jgi:hypothetical protein
MLPDMSEQSSDGPDETDEWLSAAETQRRIINVTLTSTSHIAICQRAHGGLLRAKALLLLVGDQSRPDGLIPKEFWWAGGHEALTQNWQTGDFETWIDRKLRLRAISAG